MNIFLIYPLLSRKRALIDENKQFWPPLGLAYIAGVLEKNAHRVEILDRDVVLRKSGLDFDRMDAITVKGLKAFEPAIVGISVTTPNMPDVIYVSKLIKESYPEAVVVLGGPHVTGEPVLSLQEVPYADAVARGEGEFTMLDIASGKNFNEINGLTFRDGDTIVSNPDREPIPDIDELPLPARHLLDMKFYARPSRFTGRNLNLKTTSIFTARGCPYRCNFCAGPLSFSGKVRFHSPERVAAEIEELVSRYSIEALYFAEDMFLSSRKRAEDILGLFIKNGINKKVRWIAQAKANIITEDLLRLMKEAGCVGVEYGFESGSQRMLELMNKKLKVEESVRAADLTRNSGLRFQANIIVGYPGEREEDFKKTMEFVKRIRPNMVGFNIFMPLPGTPSYCALKKEGVELPKWEDIGDPEAPQGNFADMPKEVFEKLYLEARLKVILPMNLRAFLSDNIRNPFRMLKIGLTQFKGVIIKTARSIGKLRAINTGKKGSSKSARVLFLSYNGLLEPILPSQGVPYLKGLAKNGYKFILLTYEKKKDLDNAGKDKIREIRDELASHGIEWLYLVYHKNPPLLSTLFDLARGAIHVFGIIKSKDIDIVHVRGITPGMIMILLHGLTRVRVLFDMRGLLAEEYVGGGLWRENSLPFKLVNIAERRLLEIADAVTTLTKKHFDLNKSLGCLQDRIIPMDVIPCCVDTSKFTCDENAKEDIKSQMGFAGKFILMYPGKIGTFYFLDEMLSFYKEMALSIPNSTFLILTNDSPDMVLEKARAAGVDTANIKIVHGIKFDDIPEYYKIADAGIFFINPYKKIGSSPIKMGEFLASGVPVIINPGVGDTEELVRDNRVGVIVNNFRTEDYKSAIRELLKLKDEGEILKRRCADTARKYLSLEKGIEKYLKVYDNLCRTDFKK